MTKVECRLNLIGKHSKQIQNTNNFYKVLLRDLLRIEQKNIRKDVNDSIIHLKICNFAFVFRAGFPLSLFILKY